MKNKIASLIFYAAIIAAFFSCSNSEKVVEYEVVNGDTCRIEYFPVDGKKDGVIECYDPDGNLFSREFYVMGRQQGLVTYYYSNGNVLVEANCIDSNPYGVIRRYYPNGNLMSVCECVWLYPDEDETKISGDNFINFDNKYEEGKLSYINTAETYDEDGNFEKGQSMFYAKYAGSDAIFHEDNYAIVSQADSYFVVYNLVEPFYDDQKIDVSLNIFRITKGTGDNSVLCSSPGIVMKPDGSGNIEFYVKDYGKGWYYWTGFIEEKLVEKDSLRYYFIYDSLLVK